MKSRGFSIISSLLGFSLLGISTAGLASYMGGFEQAQVEYEQQGTTPYWHTDLLQSARNILFAVNKKDDGSLHSKNEKGICAMVKQDNTYADIKGKRFGPLELKKNTIKSHLNATRWKTFLDERWEIQSAATPCSKGQNGFLDPFTIGNFKKCLKHKNQSNIYARLEIKPIHLLTGKDLTSTAVSVDQVALQLISTVSVLKPQSQEGSNTYSVTRSEVFGMAADTTDCHICNSGGKCRVVRLFASAGLGSASSQNDIFYQSNHSHKDVSDSTAKILSATALGRMDCVRDVFLCNGFTTFIQDQYDSFAQLSLSLNLDFPLDSNIDQIDVQITKGSTNYAVKGFFKTAGGLAFAAGKDFSSSTTPFWPLKSGGNELILYVNSAAPIGAKTLCELIYETSTSGNTRTYPSAYYPVLTVKWNKRTSGSQRTTTIKFDGASCNNDTPPICNPEAKIGVKACYARACHSRGKDPNSKASVGLFGPITGVPTEPIDAQFPLCKSVWNASINKSLEINSPSSLSAGDCLKWASSKLTAASSCTEKNPTNCFVQGKYRLIPQTSGVIDLGIRENACFRAGYQSWSASTVLEDLQRDYYLNPADNWECANNTSLCVSSSGVADFLSKSGINKSTSGNYKFVNSSAQGTFTTQERSKAKFQTGWVNYQVDQAGMIVGGWPVMPSAIKDAVSNADATTGVMTDTENSKVHIGKVHIGWDFFYREPFSSVHFNNIKSITTFPDGTGDAAKKTFLSRNRPSRPVFIRYPANIDFPNGVATPAGGAANARLLLTSHNLYRGLRRVNKTLNNKHAYLCTTRFPTNNGTGLKLSTIKGNSFEDGYSACRSEGRYFLPPQSSNDWVRALRKVSGKSGWAPRYAISNPFSFFLDGLPYKKVDGVRRYDYDPVDAKDFRYARSTDHLIAFTESTKAKHNATDKGKFALAPVMSVWVGLEPTREVPSATVIGGRNAEHSSEWSFNYAKVAQCTGACLTGDSYISNPSIFLNNKSATSADYGLPVVNDNSLDWSAGILSYDGRAGSIRTLRVPNDRKNLVEGLSLFCAFPNTEKQSNFHQAPLFRGSHSDWPSGSDGDAQCSNTSEGKGVSRSLSSKSVYFGTNHAEEQNANIRDLKLVTGADIDRWKKGLLVARPLMIVNHSTIFPVVNRPKFCAMWNLEKLRRSVGRCVISQWNSSGGLIAGSKRYNLSDIRSKRVTCRREFCADGTWTSASNQAKDGAVKAYDKEKAAAKTARDQAKNTWNAGSTNAVNTFNTCRSDRAAAKRRCNDTHTSCIRGVRTCNSSNSTCEACRDAATNNNCSQVAAACIACTTSGEGTCGSSCNAGAVDACGGASARSSCQTCLGGCTNATCERNCRGNKPNCAAGAGIGVGGYADMSVSACIDNGYTTLPTCSTCSTEAVCDDNKTTCITNLNNCDTLGTTMCTAQTTYNQKKGIYDCLSGLTVNSSACEGTGANRHDKHQQTYKAPATTPSSFTYTSYSFNTSTQACSIASSSNTDTCQFVYPFNYNDHNDNQCWSLQALNPRGLAKAPTSGDIVDLGLSSGFGGDKGYVGILGRNVSGEEGRGSGNKSWTADAYPPPERGCSVGLNTKLSTIPDSDCGKKYINLFNIGDDDLCDDDSSALTPSCTSITYRVNGGGNLLTPTPTPPPPPTPTPLPPMPCTCPAGYIAINGQCIPEADRDQKQTESLPCLSF